MATPDPYALADAIRKNAPSFETPEGRIFVVEKCIQLKESELIAYAEAIVAKDQAATGSKPLDLVAATINGKPMRWQAGTKLSWSLDEKSFPDTATAKQCLEYAQTAANDWNTVAEKQGVSVRFQAEDRADSPLFQIRYEAFGKSGLFAVAFFPNETANRVVRVGPALFAGTDYDSVGVMRHELGHVLGFRHEHIRPENPNQIESWTIGSISAEELTKFDAQSLMHYPLSPGFGTKDFKITATDAEGFKALYSIDSEHVEEFQP